MAAVVLATILHEQYVLASVKYSTSSIMMKMVIDHLFDHPVFYSQLESQNETDFDRLKEKRTKEELRFKDGGSLMIVSLHGSDEKMSQTIGQHKKKIILDESPLLTFGQYSQIIKMMSGYKYDETHLVEIGNTLGNNHFKQNLLSNPNYQAIRVSLNCALREGRIDPKTVEEAKGLPFFEQFYECKFPAEDVMDAAGFRQLFTTEQILAAIDTFEHSGKKKLGVDIGGGGDSSVHCLRSDTYATIANENKSKDTMTNVGIAREIKDDNDIEPRDVYPDDIGIGHGFSDRFAEIYGAVTKVIGGEKAKDSKRYKNRRAENYWHLKLWIDGGGKLDPAFKTQWMQLTWMRYKITSDKQIQIEEKAEIKKKHNNISPDYADALANTFHQRVELNVG